MAAMNTHARLTSATLAALLSLTGGCSFLQSTSIEVVDIDNAYKPVPGATVARYLTPKRAQPWPTTPTEIKQTDGEGMVHFPDGRGRYVITAPGKGSVSFYGGMPSKSIELGVGGAKP